MGPRPRPLMGTGAAGLCSVHRRKLATLSSASAVEKLRQLGYAMSLIITKSVEGMNEMWVNLGWH